MRQHLPTLWRFRLLRAVKAKGNVENRRLLRAWQLAEGGTAAFNPLNTTQPWAGATDYNSVHVRNYATGTDGIAATAATLQNGYYPGIVRDLRDGQWDAREIVTRNRREFDTWGTHATHVAAVLGFTLPPV